MNKQCEIVQDLLPLYVDDICSPASREMIREHLSTCADCAGMLKSLKNTEIEEELITEKTDVLKTQRKVFKRRSALAGLIIGMAMLIPVIVLFIVTVATRNSAKSLFIVIAALLLGASLIVVPLVALKNKFLWTAGLGTLCLLILLAVIAAFNGGTWFLIAASSILFGLTLILGPIVVNRGPIKSRLGRHKALICMAADTVLYFVMMACIGLATRNRSFWGIGFMVSAAMIVLVWLFFVIIRYLKTNGLVKAGICCIICGAFLFSINTILGLIAGYNLGWPAFYPATWNAFTVDGNVKWLCLLAGAAVGVILIIIGLIKGGKKK